MFIELTKLDNKKILLNTNNIVRVHPTQSVDCTHLHTQSGIIEVKESYDEIKNMLISPMIAYPLNQGYGELDQLYEDADDGICSNLSPETIDEVDRIRDKLFKSIGLAPTFFDNADKEGK